MIARSQRVSIPLQSGAGFWALVLKVWLAFTIAWPLVGAGATSPNQVVSVTAAQNGGATLVRIVLREPLDAPPQSFTVQTPPRIAIDLPGVEASGFSVGKAAIAGDLRGIAMAPAGERARLILNLKRSSAHMLRAQGRELLVTIDPVQPDTTVNAGRSGPASATLTQTSPGAKDALAVRDIDFRRGPNGEGKLVIEVSEADAPVDVRTQGGQLVIDIIRAKLPESLRRRFDVGDFGTPLRHFNAFQNGENTRLTLTASGTWEHGAYQSGRQFVVELKAIKDQINRIGAAKQYKGQKVSLNFHNMDLRAVLQVIADQLNLNLIATDTVQGALTLRLQDVPWDQALDIVLETKGLDIRRNGNVLWVAPREELAAREKLDLESKQQLAELEPLRNEAFQLNYQKADALGKLLSDEKQRVLSKRGSAVVDQRTNQIFVQDTAAKLEDVRRLIAKVDVPVRQVLIEARIVEADDRFSRNLGVRLGYNDRSSLVYRTVGVVDPVSGQTSALNVPVYGAGSALGAGMYGSVSGNMQGVADLSSQLGSSITGTNALGLGRETSLSNTNFVNLPAAAISGANPASLAISLFGSDLTKFVNLEVSALEADQRGKVVSSPRVLTADQGKATIEQGTELPFQQATSSGATSIAFRKANLKLEVTPQITPEGNVILDVEVNRDAVGQLTPAGFAIDTRRVKTQVLVENGGTIVIGGIYEQFERNRTNKVPLLGDLPWVGNLFKDHQRTNDRTELLVFLTPRVVTDVASR